jgi:hypothetical protein
VTGPNDVRAAAGYATRSPALDVWCSHCGAGVGEECHGRTAKTRGKRRPTHPARIAAAPDAVIIPFPQRPPPAA